MADIKHDTIDFLPLQKLVLVYEAVFGLPGSHLDLEEHVIMAALSRLIDSLEVAVNRKTCSNANFW